jgi:hypothetical protein
MAWRTLSILVNLRNCLVHRLGLLLLPCILLTFSTAYAKGQAGKTIMAKGQVTAKDQQTQRELARRSPVYTADLVSTGQLSATQLRMTDGALLSIQASSELAIARYDFNPQDRQGSVSMSLLKGGLRTVTGALQQTSDSYKLVTPVASIGVRGTHYEVELINDELYLAAWEGIIDIEVTAGSLGQRFSLGPSMAHSFAVIRVGGSVEFLLNIPSVFSVGHSSELYQQSLPQTSEAVVETELSKNVTLPIKKVGLNAIEESVYIAQTNGQIYIDNDRLISRWLPELPSNIRRTGMVVFDQIEHQAIVSSLGDVTDFSMSMSVDFDSSRIPTGNLSFSDSAGEWFAAFDGIISEYALTLSVNFASHGNNIANGTIDALLIDQGQGVFGTLSLSEVNTHTVSASGSFELRQSVP